MHFIIQFDIHVMCAGSKKYQYPLHIRVIENAKVGGVQKPISKFLTESMNRR